MVVENTVMTTTRVLKIGKGSIPGKNGSIRLNSKELLPYVGRIVRVTFSIELAYIDCIESGNRTTGVIVDNKQGNN